MSHIYEVEIKSLLGDKEKTDKLITNLHKKYSDLKLTSEGKQLNHYFNMKSGVDLEGVLSKIVSKDRMPALKKILKEGKKMSIRTRKTSNKKEDKVIMVIKASVGDDTSDNGVKRIEFEAEVNVSLDKLDKILLDAGLTYQAKWSRERKEYVSKDLHICIDKNAGYGYLAEFEKTTPDESQLDDIREEIIRLMNELGVEELGQERIERMFAHYNANWDKYYGTDKTFIID